MTYYVIRVKENNYTSKGYYVSVHKLKHSDDYIRTSDDKNDPNVKHYKTHEGALKAVDSLGVRLGLYRIYFEIEEVNSNVIIIKKEKVI